MSTTQDADTVEYLLVMHDFIARSPDELDLKKGSKVELLERDDEYGDGWYQGRNLETGKTGLFPQVYTSPWRPTPTVEKKQPLLAPPTPSTKDIEKYPLPETFDQVDSTTTSDSPQNKQIPTKSAGEEALLPDTGMVDDQGIGMLKAKSESRTSFTPSKEETLDNKIHASRTPTPPPTTNTSGDESKSSLKENGNRTTETPPLVIDNRRKSASLSSRQYSSTDSPPISGNSINSGDDPKPQSAYSKIMRSPVVEDTLSDIEQAISQIRRPRDGGKGSKNEQLQPGSKHAASRSHDHDFDDSASDYSRSIAENESTLSLTYRPEQKGFNGQHQPHPSFPYDERQGVVSASSSESGDIYYTLEDVRSWTPAQVSAYLQEQQLPVNICEKFEDQEITGSILLQLEMAHLKELDIPSFGKRFEVWKEIERLKEILGLAPDESVPANQRGTPVEEGSRGSRSRSSTTGGSGTAVLPRLPSLHNRPPSKQLSLSATPGHEGYDPSLADRSTTATSESGASSQKRLSSGQAHPYGQINAKDLANPTGVPTHHGREPSFDRNWSLSLAGSRLNARAGESTHGDDMKGLPNSHARKSSYTEEARQRAGQNTTRHSRAGSGELLRAATTSPRSPNSSQAAMAYHSPRGRKKLPPQPTPDAYLYEQPRMPGGMVQQTKQLSVDIPDDISSPEATTSPKRRKIRLPIHISTKQARAASDGTEKMMSPQSAGAMTSTTLTSEGNGSNASIAQTGDGDSRTNESSSPNASNKALRSVVSASGLRQQKKKSRTIPLYLLDISPAQAASEGDFSGWMKKRGSGGVVGSWKSRFFVLKGRRLSYFYSLDDTKERGLIDITSHRVLNAADDRLVNLHASVAAITTSTPVGQESSAAEGNSPTASPTTTAHKGSWFIFKLVPPAPGAAKGVTFTPPKVHYFATDSREVGRKWMAAMMKATIDRDETQPVVSSFSAATISLAKARELRTRPPGFGDDNNNINNNNGNDNDIPDEKIAGVGILGLDFDIDPTIGDLSSPEKDEVVADIEGRKGHIKRDSQTDGVNRTKSQPTPHNVAGR